MYGTSLRSSLPVLLEVSNQTVSPLLMLADHSCHPLLSECTAFLPAPGNSCSYGVNLVATESIGGLRLLHIAVAPLQWQVNMQASTSNAEKTENAREECL